MERIKKALELAREQRIQLAKASPEVEQETPSQQQSRPEPVELEGESETPNAKIGGISEEKIDAEIEAEADQADTLPPIVSKQATDEILSREIAPDSMRSDPVVDLAIEPIHEPAPEKSISPNLKRSGPDRVKAAKSRKKERNSQLKSAVPSDIEYSQTRRVEVSADRLEENRIIAGIKNHPQSDLFRVLRTKILHRMRTDKINSLAITSPTKGAGKSMISANLAVSLALESNQTVMLVDLDLRKPTISHYFSLDAQQGVSDYLIDNAELPGLLVYPGIERLVILPAGNPAPQSSELLSTPRMNHLVEDIINRYTDRIVLFDLPPLLHLDDALIFLPQVQSSLLVMEEGVNTPAEIEQSLMLLEKANLLGTVYNKARQTKHLPY